MQPETQPLSFGQYLKECREQKGIRLDALARETRIGLDKLLLIEMDYHEKLPAEIYVTGFVKAYARAVGADQTKVLALFQASLREYQEKVRIEAQRLKAYANFWPRLLLSLLLLVLLMLATIFLTPVIQSFFDSPASAPPILTKHSPAPDTPPVTPPPPTSKQVLEISAEAPNWIKVITDNQASRTYELKAGEQLRLEAASGFNLLIGHDEGVRVRFNGRNVHLIAKGGQAINLVLP